MLPGNTNGLASGNHILEARSHGFARWSNAIDHVVEASDSTPRAHAIDLSTDDDCLIVLAELERADRSRSLGHDHRFGIAASIALSPIAATTTPTPERRGLIPRGRRSAARIHRSDPSAHHLHRRLAR